MMIRGSATAIFAAGIMLWLACKTIPLLMQIGMDYVAIFMMVGGIFILLFVFGISETGKQYDSLPPGGALINFIRRDGHIVPLIGKRVFTGESFLEIPKLGLIEDLGKDTVFTWGRKRVRFGLENINYTPDPRFWNLTRELYKMGFDDSEDLYNVLNIPNMDPVTDRAKKIQYLERMGKIYWYMTHQEQHGAKHLMDIFKKKRSKKIVYGIPRKKEEIKDEPRQPEKTKEVDYKKIDTIIDCDRDEETGGFPV